MNRMYMHNAFYKASGFKHLKDLEISSVNRSLSNLQFFVLSLFLKLALPLLMTTLIQQTICQEFKPL